MIDRSHAPARRSWVASANQHPEFPIQNLPFGVFTPEGGRPRGGIAIGDEIFDIASALKLGLFNGPAARAAEAACGATLNSFFALGSEARNALRQAAGDVLDAEGKDRAQIEGLRTDFIHSAATCRLEVPAMVGDYTDFFAGIHHATNAGKLLRPDNPLLPNYKHLPVGYHGRASSIVSSGMPVRRPSGQRIRARAYPNSASEVGPSRIDPTWAAAGEQGPSFGPSRSLDFELELGVWIGPGNPLGTPIAVGRAADHIAGFCLLNDWSARDIQAFEYQPLGPFLGKNFCTTVSPWVITPEALAPFRMPQPPRPPEDAIPLPYLLDPSDQAAGALDIELEVFLCSQGLQSKGLAAQRLAASNARHLYWTVAQLVAHHTCGGCNLRAGDLFGTGTISSDAPDGLGSLLEISAGGRRPIELASGETRRFLEDGDTIILRAHCRREGFATIGFGECRGTIAPAA
jgi:fumarylacetoacetase